MSFNRFVYANNNPFRYSDPDGKEPIRSLVASPSDFIDLYKDHFANSSNDASALLHMYSNSLYEESRYVYTTERGFIDMKHFAASFANARLHSRRTSKFFGRAMERFQSIAGHQSANSYEDYPSNNAGLEFSGTFGHFSASSFLQALTEFFINEGALDADDPNNPEYLLQENERQQPPTNTDPDSTGPVEPYYNESYGP